MGKNKQLKQELEQAKKLLAQLYTLTEIHMFNTPFGVCEKCGAPRVYVNDSDTVWKPTHYTWCIFYEIGKFLGITNTQVSTYSCCSELKEDRNMSK